MTWSRLSWPSVARVTRCMIERTQKPHLFAPFGGEWNALSGVGSMWMRANELELVNPDQRTSGCVRPSPGPTRLAAQTRLRVEGRAGACYIWL